MEIPKLAKKSNDCRPGANTAYVPNGFVADVDGSSCSSKVAYSSTVPEGSDQPKSVTLKNDMTYTVIPLNQNGLPNCSMIDRSTLRLSNKDKFTRQDDRVSLGSFIDKVIEKLKVCQSLALVDTIGASDSERYPELKRLLSNNTTVIDATNTDSKESVGQLTTPSLCAEVNTNVSFSFFKVPPKQVQSISVKPEVSVELNSSEYSRSASEKCIDERIGDLCINKESDTVLGRKIDSIQIIKYSNEAQIHDIMRLITRDLSEPYSIYTYRYFIYNWPQLCYLAKSGDLYVGAIVCKLSLHGRNIRRGYIAMLAVDEKYRRLKIGTGLVTKAIEAMIIDGCDEVVLETEVTNKSAMKLYENLGFVRDKRLFRYYLNGVDAFRLKLWLKSSEMLQYL